MNGVALDEAELKSYIGRKAREEDLATARISVAQTAQRIIHEAKDSDSGEVHDMGPSEVGDLRGREFAAVGQRVVRNLCLSFICLFSSSVSWWARIMGSAAS